jgi:hypothetical protein
VRVQADTRVLDITPGNRAEVNLDVVNTTEVIDGVRARIIGLEPEHVTTKPDLLSLFPDTSGRLTLTLGLPVQFPAGRHPVTVEVASSAGAAAPHHVDLDLLVAPHAAVQLRVRPALVRARRRGSFVVECINRGNVPLELALSAVDPDRSLRCSFEPSTVTVEPAAMRTSILTIRAPRLLVGNEIDRPVTIRGEGSGVSGEGPATLRQRPLLSRGLLTVLVLMSIVGLWALAFLLGLTKVFSGDPLTKSAPASFFAAAATGPAAGSPGSATGAAAGAAGHPGAAPPGALPKSGVLPPGVGAAISGSVTAASTGDGVGRIVVEALRQTKSGLQLVTSAATQADGSYSLVGLFPDNYLLRFSAPGYTTVWYPAASGQGGATAVTATTQKVASGFNVKIVGLPASISGQVDPGDTLTPPTTTVTVRPLGGAGTSGADGTAATAASPAPAGGSATGTAGAGVIATVTTDASGHYAITGLPSPNTYEIGFTTPGYQPTTVVDRVGGGQDRSEPTVRLSAALGTISGTVTDGARPLGGVKVTTTVNGQQVTTGTPTVGTVGTFAISGLATPGTYILTFTLDKYGAQTVAVDLGPGQQRTDLAVTMVGGTGTASGHLVDSAGKGIGGATVTVGGTTKPVTTTTLTTGDVGSFVISGLPTPGSYTLTFALGGYQSQTVPVVLDSDHPAPSVTVTLTRGVGRIVGQVYDPTHTANVGATVTVTDGKNVFTTTSVDSPSPGSYVVADLPPGTYTVTVSRDGYGPQTALVTVSPGSDTRQDLQLQLGGG